MAGEVRRAHAQGDVGPVQGAGAAVDGGGEVGELITAKRARKASAKVVRRAPRNVEEAIRAAEGVLPGRLKRGTGGDPRSQAILLVDAFAKSDPEAVLGFAERWGRHRSADLRAAVGTILIEDLFNAHFEQVFPQLVRLVRADPRFADTVSICYFSGLPHSQARRFARLKQEAYARADRWRAAGRRRRRRRR